MPFSKDAYDEPLVLQGLAQVHTWSGEPDAVMEIIEELLSVPGYMSRRLRRRMDWSRLNDREFPTP